MAAAETWVKISNYIRWESNGQRCHYVDYARLCGTVRQYVNILSGYNELTYSMISSLLLNVQKLLCANNKHWTG